MATAWSSSSDRSRRRTSATDPSAVLTRADVAVSGSTYNTAVCVELVALPTACARAAVDDVNRGVRTDASAAPRASTSSGSSGAFTGSDVAAS
ncbi:MAG: hypothetical protein J2P17_35200, partial [Mycobacterium sp.]|nr:hypothetical protein [Mycobacterium sp.]